MRLMVDALKYACDQKNIYPQIGVTVFRIWVIILAFVGIQLAWNLRPFLCEKNEEFKWFRKYEGNFYTAMIYSVEQLVSPKPPAEKPPQPPDQINTRSPKPRPIPLNFYIKPEDSPWKIL